MNVWQIENPIKRRTILVLVMPYVLFMHFKHAMQHTFWPNLKFDVKGAWTGGK